ncbi:hypothetical protein DMC47_08960 [Nostoc sp. 3335mG]|nr:hypothetical protein DMC47_08960 [Nostoc sp. 3335mG]
MAVVLGIPGGILAWSQWTESAKNEQLDREAAKRAERVANAEEAQANAMTAMTTFPKEAKEPASQPAEPRQPITIVQAPPRVIVQSRTAYNDAALSRPYISLKDWSLQKVALGEKPEWSVTMENSGRPTMVSATQFQAFVESDSPPVVPSCSDTLEYGSSSPIKGSQRSTLRASVPVDQAGWDAYQRGTPLMVSATYCYKDDLTNRIHVTHICLKGYASGAVHQCRRGNDAS